MCVCVCVCVCVAGGYICAMMKGIEWNLHGFLKTCLRPSVGHMNLINMYSNKLNIVIAIIFYKSCDTVIVAVHYSQP